MIYPHLFSIFPSFDLDAYIPFFKNITSINQIEQLKLKFKHIPVNEVLTIVKLQNQSINKLKISDNWILTEKNLQQASSYKVAEYHGKIFKRFTSVADICCGIGMDLYFLSEDKKYSHAVDYNKEILTYCKFNMSKSGRSNISFSAEKAEECKVIAEAYFIDPDRRNQKQRIIKPELLSPNLYSLLNHSFIKKNLAIKLSPAMDYENYSIFQKGTLEFISENGELKEILFCLGDLASKKSKKCVILNENDTFHPDGSTDLADISGFKNYLYEPDPSIIRAHLINDFARYHCLNKIDEKLALLTNDSIVNTKHGRWYEVIDDFKFDIKKLNQYLTYHNIGILDIKTRGFSQTVESFRKNIKLKGSEKAILFILKMNNNHHMIICQTV